MSGRRESGRMYTQNETLSGGLFSGIMRNIASKIPVEKRPLKEVKVDGRHQNGVKVSDEVVKEILRLSMDGATPTDLSKRFGVSTGVIGQWKRGSNRGHLLLEVERERR